MFSQSIFYRKPAIANSVTHHVNHTYFKAHPGPKLVSTIVTATSQWKAGYPTMKCKKTRHTLLQAFQTSTSTTETKRTEDRRDK